MQAKREPGLKINHRSVKYSSYIAAIFFRLMYTFLLLSDLPVSPPLKAAIPAAPISDVNLSKGRRY